METVTSNAKSRRSARDGETSELGAFGCHHSGEYERDAVNASAVGIGDGLIELHVPL